MPLQFIQTQTDLASRTEVRQLIEGILSSFEDEPLDVGSLYYGWPTFIDYDLVRHSADIALIMKSGALFLIKHSPLPNLESISKAADSLLQVTATATSQLIRSPLLRVRRGLKVAIVPVVYSPGSAQLAIDDVDLFTSEQALIASISEANEHELSDDEYAEVGSILEGAKALGRPQKRIVTNPDTQRIAIAASALEEEIASFDAKQRQVALQAFLGPQRIRGLAGSGKTVILAMKAALAHLEDPTKRILITHYTRSLRHQLTKLVSRFHRHFGVGEPDWDFVHIRHGWGQKDLPGVYTEACGRAGISPVNLTAAQTKKNANQQPFEYVCEALLKLTTPEPYYDLVLIDEGQDYPDTYYQLCFHITKGLRDEKRIVWAYDELQDVFDIKVRSPKELFGTDVDGQPRIDLDRALPSTVETNDFVLPKSYRNQRDVLVLAHATGFGVYGPQIVQMLQDPAHWRDVGYDIVSGDMTPATLVKVVRPDRNSPSRLQSPADVPLIDYQHFETFAEEVSYCAAEIKKFVDGGLQPEDIMAIAIDDRSAKDYLSALSVYLQQYGIQSNNIIADRYSEPNFSIEGKVTLTTVYRAKGNESLVVVVLGTDAVPLNARTGRNRLFTALTRTKGWLRVSGIVPMFLKVKAEIRKALELTPEMHFTMPDMTQVEMIQRDLTERAAKYNAAQIEIDRLIERYSLTEDEVKSMLGKQKPRKKRK